MARSEKLRKAINHRFKRRQARLAKMNARNLKNFNRAVARGQAKFAAAAKSNKAKSALAAARIKLQAAVNKINEKHTKKRAAAFNKKELRAKKQLKNKELKLKAAHKKKQSESRQKEKNHKANKAAEADLKYKKKAAKAAAMEKDAKEAKAAAAKKAEATQASWDAGIKECNSSTECLLNGKECQKTGKKTGWYLDQVGFVKCVKTKPQNMIGDWAGTPFKETDFPEATYHEPKFVMPVMPGFKSWKISDHYDKVKAKIKAGIKKAAKHDSK